MRLLRHGWICCGIALGLVALPVRPLGAEAGDAPARSASRLELEVPNSGNLLVEADRIYVPPGASPHAPLSLPPPLPLSGQDRRGQVRVDLPAGSGRPATTEIWASGTITVTLPSGARLRLGSLVPRARITFEKPDAAWRVIVEPLPPSTEFK
jgi:hypothetical protein